MQYTLYKILALLFKSCNLKHHQKLLLELLFHLFLLLPKPLFLPCLPAPQQEDLLVISAEGGLLSPTMLSLSVFLLSPSSDLSTVKEMCVCVCVCICVFMLLRYFLCLPLSFYFCSFLELLFFSQISATSCSSPSTLSLCLSLALHQPTKKNILLVAMGSGCHAPRFPHGSCMYACLL